jgi:hypothetical protein
MVYPHIYTGDIKTNTLALISATKTLAQTNLLATKPASNATNEKSTAQKPIPTPAHFALANATNEDFIADTTFSNIRNARTAYSPLLHPQALAIQMGLWSEKAL